MADSVARTGSFRKRPLEERKSDGTEALASKHERSYSDSDMEQEDTGSSGVLDEIEEHFQRSLAKIKQQQQQQLQSDSLKQQPSILSKSLLSDTHKITVTENNSLSTSPNNNAPGSPQQQRNHQQQQQQQQQQHRQRMIAKPTVVLPASTLAVTAINSQLNVATASVPKSPRQHHKTPLTPQKTAVTPLHTFSTLSSSSSSSPSPSPAVPTIVSIPNASTFTQQPFLVTTSQGPQVFNPATATVLQTPGGGLQLIDLTKSLAQNAVVSSNVSSAMGAGGAQFSFTSLPAGGQNLLQGATTPSTPKTPQKNVVTSAFGTPTLLTQQQVAAAVGGAMATPSIMPMLDSSQFMQTGAAGNSPILILPTAAAGGGGGGGIPQLQQVMQPQPFILVNPSDIGSFQQANFLAAAAAATATGGGGMIPGISPSLAGGGGGGGGGGYIIVPSGAFPTSPFVTFTGAGNQSVVVSTTPAASTAQLPTQLLYQQAAAAAAGGLKPAITTTMATLPQQQQQQQQQQAVASTQPRATVNPLKRTRNPLEGAQSSKDDAINMTPASVEDHFAKALGDQWSKVKTSYPFQLETAAASAENAVVS